MWSVGEAEATTKTATRGGAMDEAVRDGCDGSRGSSYHEGGVGGGSGSFGDSIKCHGWISRVRRTATAVKEQRCSGKGDDEVSLRFLKV